MFDCYGCERARAAECTGGLSKRSSLTQCAVAARAACQVALQRPGVAWPAQSSGGLGRSSYEGHTCCLLCCCLRLFRATEGCITSCLQDASMPIALILDTKAMAVCRLQAAQPQYDIIVDFIMHASIMAEWREVWRYSQT